MTYNLFIDDERDPGNVHVATQKHWMYGAGRQHETNGIK
jgi:hypothetical protein